MLFRRNGLFSLGSITMHDDNEQCLEQLKVFNDMKMSCISLVGKLNIMYYYCC